MLEIVLADKFIFNYKIKIRQFRGWGDGTARDYRNVPVASSFPLRHSIICQWELEPMKGMHITETYTWTHRHSPHEGDAHSCLFNAKGNK